MSEDTEGIPPNLREFAEKIGLTQKPGETDENYIRRLHGMMGHLRLARRVVEYGGQVGFGMNTQQLRAALNHRLLQLLSDHGVRQGLELTYRDKRYRVRKIYETTGTRMNPAEVKVQIWFVEWNKPNDNRGRTIYVTAMEILKSLGVPATNDIS